MASPVFQYTSLYVRISEAKKLPSRDMSGMRDPFCVLKVDNETIGRTATAFKTLEPFWGEEYNLHVPNEFQDIAVYVYDYDIMGSKEPIGKVLLDREAIVRSPRGIDRWFPLTRISKEDEVQGEILVEIALDNFGHDNNRVVLTLVEARDLVAHNGKSDPFATVYFSDEEFSTQVLQKTRFPRWKKTFELLTSKDSRGSNDLKVVKIVVYNFDKFAHNHFMGQVEVDLKEMQVGQRYKTWYRLQHHEPKHKDKKKELGSVRLKVQCREERILDSKFYVAFVDLMIRAVEDHRPDGSPLLVMLEEVMTADRNTMGHALVRFFLAHGRVLPLLDALTTREIQMTGDPRTLFRGNSLASKSFDQFMKVVALPYLHETLSSSIEAVFSDHKLCELDVEQLKQASRARSGHTATLSAIKTAEVSVTTLGIYLEMILSAILSSVDKCPNLLRLALRQLWIRVAERYKDPEQADVPYLAVTGFLFLRFFVPAILSPKLFALRDEHPDQKIERTLKLIAKVLQSMSNLQVEMDAKEAYMQPINPVLPEGVRRIKEFVQDLVQVDQKRVSSEIGVKDGGYIHHLILCKGWLWKRSASASFQYRRRYFELSTINLTYSQNEKNAGEVKSFPVQWIRVVEKLDDGAFHRKHMFQVVIISPLPPLGPMEPVNTTLYLQAADVNEQNRWVSAIRKACLTNRGMSPVYHPGAFKKSKWSCCRTPASQEPGCSQCHRGITIGDWRDPLDPDLDAQAVFSQFSQGRSALVKKYLPGGDDGTASVSTREDSSSPTSLTSSGATSLQLQDDEAGSTDTTMEVECRELLAVMEDLLWHHAQVHA